MEHNSRDSVKRDPQSKDITQELTENLSETVNAVDYPHLILSTYENALIEEKAERNHTISDDRKSLKNENPTRNTDSAEEFNVVQAANDDKHKISEDSEQPEKISEKLESSYLFSENVYPGLNPSESINNTDTARERRRQELIDRQNELLERQRKAAQFSLQLQTTLSNYFRRKRVDAVEISHYHDSAASSALSISKDYSSDYAKHLKSLSQIREQYSELKERLDADISSMKDLSEKKVAEATKTHDELVDFILQLGSQAISSKTGRAVSVDTYKDLIDAWQRKNAAVKVERLENIKLQRQVEKIKDMFKAYDISESLHLIDFEQMKIENQTYNEKIEARNEETGKLKRKINNTVQILTHSNEKLSSYEAEFFQLKNQLNELTDKLNSSRDSLAKLKQKRDALRNDYAALQKACGLLGQTEMLRGFEENVDNLEAKKQELSSLKQQTREFRAKTKHYEQMIFNVNGENLSIPNKI